MRRWLSHKDEERSEISEAVRNAIASLLMNTDKVVIIERLTINVNYASGGGAKVVATQRDS